MNKLELKIGNEVEFTYHPLHRPAIEQGLGTKGIGTITEVLRRYKRRQYYRVTVDTKTYVTSSYSITRVIK